jgi:hypothetical protein
MINSRIILHRMTAVVALVSAGCRSIALSSAPAKIAAVARSESAVHAKAAFERALLDGDYEALDSITEVLTAAYLNAPRDPTLALYVGHAHFWRVTERVREPAPRATVTDHLLLAHAYFDQARKLASDDARILGWLGGVTMALGSIHRDERLVREGYFMLEDGVAEFPEFNHFSKGYALSQLPRAHPRFEEALEAMWRSIEVCQPGFERAHPDYSRGLTAQGPPESGARRVCYNLPKAPHNFEGFFLQNGDMLVKSGDPARARVMYANARLAPSFAGWAYRDVLEERIRTAEQRARAFGANDVKAWPEMMVSSRAACTGCHQR